MVPWRLKILSKIVLSRVPIGYRLRARMGIFKHGRMASIDYPQQVFEHHRAYAIANDVRLEGAVVLEMGTGDSVASALVARQAGTARCYLLDVGDFATRDMRFYRRLAALIELPLPVTMGFADMLSHVGGVQLVNGLASWSEVPDSTLDFIWSHSTLEHVRRHEFDATLARMFRAMRPGAIASHNIHLPDHLGGALNNLRFSDRVWEADWFAKSGFYTNRLRPSEIRAAFERAGFELVHVATAKWPSLPTPRSAMSPRFAQMSDDDLLATGMHLVARRP